MELLKRIVIKEELVALTGDFKKAIILNQLLYWSERVKDFDKFIIEEKTRYEKDGEKNNMQLQNGWIYKTAEELSEETMLGLSKSNIRLHIKSLIESGWIDERLNPNFKWDKTMQYRVNILKLQEDLYKLGYALEGYPLFFHEENEIIEQQDDDELEPEKQNIESRSSKIEPRKFQQKIDIKKIKPRSSETEQQYQRLLSENNNIYIYSQSVNNEKCRESKNDDRGGPTEQKEMDQAKAKVKSMGYPCLEEEMIINSLVDIIQSKGTELIDKLTDKKIIDFAINKFKKLDKTKIKNHQAYFTSVLNNSVFEYAASEVAGQDQKSDIVKTSKNKFHNFPQRMVNYSEEQLEQIVRQKFSQKVQSLTMKKERENKL